MRKMRLIGAVLALSEVTAACTDSDEERVDASWPNEITFGFVTSSEQEKLQDNVDPIMEVLVDALVFMVECVLT